MNEWMNEWPTSLLFVGPFIGKLAYVVILRYVLVVGTREPMRTCLENIGVDVRIILKLILKK
jgi:hypothetical protein